MKLQVVTIDGTVIEVDQFQTGNKGLKLQQTSQQNGSQSKPETIGFVPFDRLMYVIPENITHNVDQLEGVPL